MSVGIDIVDLTRISLKDSFVNHILTEAEQEEYRRLNLDSRKKEYIGGRFAAKEAIFKATQASDYLSFSILHQKNGKPYVLHHPELEISISHDGDYCIAACLYTEKNEIPA